MECIFSDWSFAFIITIEMVCESNSNSLLFPLRSNAKIIGKRYDGPIAIRSGLFPDTRRYYVERLIDWLIDCSVKWWLFYTDTSKFLHILFLKLVCSWWKLYCFNDVKWVCGLTNGRSGALLARISGSLAAGGQCDKSSKHKSLIPDRFGHLDLLHGHWD